MKIGSMLAVAVGAMVGGSLVAQAAYAVMTSAYAAGHADSPADSSCFFDNYGSVENICSTARTWVGTVSRPSGLADSFNYTLYNAEIWVGANSTNSHCFMVNATIDSTPATGTGVYFGTNTALTNGWTTIGYWAIGQQNTAISIYCSIPQYKSVGPFWVVESPS